MVTLVVLVLVVVVVARCSSGDGATQSTDATLPDASSVETTLSEGDSPTSEDEPTADSAEPSETDAEAQGDHTVEVVDGCTYVDGILIVNKSYSVPPEYQGYEGGYDDTKPTPPQGLFPEVIEAFDQMQTDAQSEGLDIYIASGYRSYYYQQNVYARYCEVDSPEVVDTYSARAGYSEHQSGYAFDLNSIDDSFADTAEGQWVAENCYRYGFVVRFPEDKEDVTGYQYESWHLRYVGVDVATYMYENNLCLEEYLGVDSVYPD